MPNADLAALILGAIVVLALASDKVSRELVVLFLHRLGDRLGPVMREEESPAADVDYLRAHDSIAEMRAEREAETDAMRAFRAAGAERRRRAEEHAARARAERERNLGSAA